MKKMLILLLVLSFSCKSGDSTTKNIEAQTLVYYSKSACLGKCKAYDLWIYGDGTLKYTVITTKEQKNYYKKISEQELVDLLMELTSDELVAPDVKKVRDRPVTRLRFEGKELVYDASRITGMLKMANTRLQNIAARIDSSSL